MSDQQIRYPGGPGSTTAEGEPGFAAVRGRYGNDMVQRMLNWPHLAETYCRAQNGDETMVAAETEKARHAMNRARADREFALEQAASIARKMPKLQWPVVPSISQLRREWDIEDGTAPVRLRVGSVKT